MITAPVLQIWDEDGSTGLAVLESTTAWAISDVFSDVGSLTLTVPRDAGGASSLLVDADRQIRVRLQGAPDMWFLLDDDSWAGASDAPESEPHTIACRSLAGVLDEVHLTAEVSHASDTPGKIVADAFDDAVARGFCENVTLNGDATNDAGGDAWPDTVDVTYPADTSLLAIL